MQINNSTKISISVRIEKPRLPLLRFPLLSLCHLVAKLLASESSINSSLDSD